jgi:hypothetical protein
MGRSKSLFPIIVMLVAAGGIVFFYQRNSHMIAQNIVLQYMLIGALFLIGVCFLFYLVT